MFDIVVIGGQTQLLPVATIAEVEICIIKRRRDVAGAFRTNPRSVTRCKMLATRSELRRTLLQTLGRVLETRLKCSRHRSAASAPENFTICHFQAWRSSSMLHVRSGTSWIHCDNTRGVQGPRMMCAFSPGTRCGWSAQLSLSVKETGGIVHSAQRRLWARRLKSHGAAM